MTPAQEWGAELRRALQRRGYTQWRLTTELRVGHGTVEGWALGRSLPSLELALAAAEVLSWARLRSLIETLRTRTCERCGQTFMTKKALDARWCSGRCRQYRHWPKNNAQRSERHRLRVGRLLSVYQETARRMCLEWCPGGREDGVCPDATCPTQEMGLSPLPVGSGRLQEVA